MATTLLKTLWLQLKEFVNNMRLDKLFESTEFEQYSDAFAAKGIQTLDALRKLQKDPDKYVQVLNEIEPDDIKMLDLFAFLKNASPDEPKKKKGIYWFFVLIISLAIFLIAFYNNSNENESSSPESNREVPNNYSSSLEENDDLDTDEDGVIDSNDECVYEPGPSENNGCPWPDTDFDGVPDKDDECISDYGPVDNNGCPLLDSDNDGILDIDDDCVSEYGPEENNGCPWPDYDNDGVIDKDDECKYKYGPAANNGCPWPDYDNDGVLDKDDKCPYQYGSRYNNGCPRETKNYSFEITIDTGRDISFYLSSDGSNWERKEVRDGYKYTYKYNKSTIKWKCTTSGSSPVVYNIVSSEQYVMKWNSTDQVWDLYRK